MKKLTCLFGAAVILTSTTGCGNVFRPGFDVAPANSYRIPGKSASSSDEDSNYSCSGRYDIVPQNDSLADGTGYFTVCTPKDIASAWSILVHGMTESSNTICVFPAVESTSGDISWIRDPATGNPTYLCSPATTTGAYFVFPTLSRAKIEFNAAFIVESQDASKMLQCLMQKFAYCPRYSSGKFR